MNNLLKHKFIVITGDNGNALGVIRSLGEVGIKPVCIYLIEKTHLPLLIKSRYLDVIHKTQSYEEGIEVLLKLYSNEEYPPFVYVCDDSIQSLVDQCYNELKDKFILFNAAEQGRINKLMDKHYICEIAQDCGCFIPKQEVVDKGVLPKTLKYPIITKTLMSIMGAWKADSYICRDEKELLEAYSKIQSPKLLLQEYIEKKNELALQGLSVNEGQDVYIPYGVSFFRFSKKGYGHYMYVRLMNDNELIQKVKDIIRKCRYSGCFEVEFLVDNDDRYWFLEVNFRFSFWNYAVTYGGINYPLLWAESTLAGKIITPEESAYAKLPIKNYFTALSEAGDFGQSVVKGKISFFRWLKDIHKADMLYLYNPNDKMPAWSFWYHKVIRKIMGKR